MDIEFIREWFERAEQCNDDIDKFICYYIAFNHLYGAEVDYEAKKVGELDLIHKCVRKYMQQGYNPYEYISSESELMKGVQSQRYKSKKTRATRLRRLDIKELFTSIYYVRCNLFHGAKSMSNDRNIELIKDSWPILRTLLLLVVE